VLFPAGPTSAYSVIKHTSKGDRTYRRSQIYFDQYTGAILKVEDASRASAGTRLFDLAGPLHYGSYGALWLRWLWVLVGFTAPLLFFSGFFMWRNRALARRRKRKDLIPNPSMEAQI
jgi:uncharacterized iron-regulated membrane protein